MLRCLTLGSGDGSKMVHGEFDLLLGDCSGFVSNHVVMLTENNCEETMGGPETSGTKSATGRSLAGKLLRKANTPTLDSAHTLVIPPPPPICEG